MNRKWIVVPSLLVLAAIGTVAAIPALQRSWQGLGPQPELVLDHAMRGKVIDTLVAELNDHYVFPDKAKEIEAVLHQRQQEGRYDGIRSGRRLARQLTADLHGVAKDRHMKVRFAPDMILPDGAGAPPASQVEGGQRNNFVVRLIQRHMATRGVVRVGHLGANIGYLKISGFPAAFLIAEKFGTAMDEIADTDGLIVDLRYNSGGSAQSAALLISYFVDRRTRLNDIWDRDTGVTTQQWTEDQLHGARYGGKKPVLVLVGPDTKSAGEDFAYTMQALERATVIGERTWGGAHPTSIHRIGEHFVAMIPGQRAINPITHTNWEGVGVTPDIEATTDSAIAVARHLLQRRLHGTAPLVAARH